MAATEPLPAPSQPSVQLPSQQSVPVAGAAKPRPMAAPIAAPIGTKRRRSRISLADLEQADETPTKEVRNVALEPVALNDEVLQRLWKRLLAECENPAVSELLYSRRVQAVDADTFLIVTTDKDFVAQFATCKDYVERQMQAYANNDHVHCTVQLEEARKRSAYDPEEKYAAMLRQNPSMETLRRLFPNLEIG